MVVESLAADGLVAPFPLQVAGKTGEALEIAAMKVIDRMHRDGESSGGGRRTSDTVVFPPAFREDHRSSY